MPLPPASVIPPSEDALVKDLETWRRHGVLRLRDLELPALRQAAMATGLAETSYQAAEPSVLTELARTAIAPIAGSVSGRTAVVLLGLDPNTFDLAPHLLREEAADVYGLGLERFRRDPQRQVLLIVATKLLELCNAHRVRVERLAMEQRHPVDSRLAIKWLERFEAYFKIWTPVYALGAGLTAYRSTLIETERPWDEHHESAGKQAYTQELQATGYGTFALFRVTEFLAALNELAVRYGGLWLLSTPAAEVAARDSLVNVTQHLPLNDRDQSWLRTAHEECCGEMHRFLEHLQTDGIGQATHVEWQSWLATCPCAWDWRTFDPTIEYFPTGRYHGEIRQDCLVHQVVEACNSYCTVIESDWLRVADWYGAFGGLAANSLDGSRRGKTNT